MEQREYSRPRLKTYPAGHDKSDRHDTTASRGKARMSNNPLRKYWLLARLGIACTFLGVACSGQTASEGPEHFRIEITGSAWILNTGGQIQANGSPIDLVNDLGAQQQKPTFYGQLVFKPGQRHRIVLEGTPFDIQGNNTVDRTVTYRNQVFNVSQTLQSTANLTYFFGGYQYDVLSGSMGHLGFSAGAAYLSATGTIQALQTNTVASKSEVIGLPLAGAEFRIFPIPGHRILEVDGGMRGMGFGSYGHYVQANANAGVGLGPITLQAGYRAVNTDLHQSSNGGSGLSARLQGPIFSLMFRW